MAHGRSVSIPRQQQKECLVFLLPENILPLVRRLQLQSDLQSVNSRLDSHSDPRFASLAGGHVQDPPRDSRVHVAGGQSLHPALLRARPRPSRHRFGPAHRRVPDRHQPQEEEQGELHRWGGMTFGRSQLGFLRVYAKATVSAVVTVLAIED